MDLKPGGSVSGDPATNDASRQTAASIARKKVLAAYGNSRQTTTDSHTTKSAETRGQVTRPASFDTQKTSQISQPPAHPSPTQSGTHLKDQPSPSRINSESWKKYHSAWQNYYQKYYGEYYAKAARTYVEKERLKDARKRAEEQDTLEYIERTTGKHSKQSGATSTTKPSNNSAFGQVISSADTPDSDSIGAKLKNTIRKKAVKNVKKSRRRRHWIPVLAGLAVVLLVLFIQYNRLIFAPIYAYVSPGNAPASQIEAIDPTIEQQISADPRLIIPKINVDVPVHFGIPLSEVMNAMADGVAHYRIPGASAFPGEVGNTVITGHSAGDIYSTNSYKYIFSGLERLEEGDLIYINYESVRYTYRVTEKKVVEPSNVASLVVDTNKPILTLVTCTPLGTSRYRLLVFADQISPSYDEAEAPEDTEIFVDDGDNEDANSDSSLPSNEPSFFEGIWNFMTGN